MTTSFLSIYDLFLKQLQNQAFLKKLPLELQEEILESFLMYAIVEFDSSNIPLDFDIERKEFLNVLTLDEIMILSHYMQLAWLTRMTNDEAMIKRMVGNRDYSVFSPANLLKELTAYQEKMVKKTSRMKLKYNNKHELKGW